MSLSSRLLYQRKVFIVPYVTCRPQVICAARALSLDYGMRLCHGSKSCSSGEKVCGVSLLVLTTCRAAWIVITHSELQIYNIIAKFDDRAGAGLVCCHHVRLVGTHTHARVYAWLMRDELTMRLRSGLFKR